MQILLFLLLLTFAYCTDPVLQQHTLKVYGNASMGYYFAKIYVGHPPQQQSVIIDTGSGQLALPCNKCTKCNPKHLNEPFDMSKSKTAEYVTCDSEQSLCRSCANKNPAESCKFTISYAEGSSLNGIIIKDSIQFQSFSEGQEIVASFGCTTKQTNLFLNQEANGIFGLSPDRNSLLLQDLYKKHHGYTSQQLQFSLCLAGNGGIMTIGKINDQLHKNSSSIKTTYSKTRNLYSLNNIGNIKIREKLIHKKDENLGAFGLFVDSGSTFTYFPNQNFQIFKEELLSSCSNQKQICELAQGQTTLCFHIKGNNDILQTLSLIFPPIQIEISQKSTMWKPQKYFLLRDKINREVCLGIEALDRYLLGANWMVDKDIIFNIKQNTIQIFYQVDCSGKQEPIRYMSQYSQQVQGHDPLKYQAPAETKHGFEFLILFGVILIIIGTGGLVVAILWHYDKKQKKQHQLVSGVEQQESAQIVSEGRSIQIIET